MLGRATILLLVGQGVLMVSGYAINVALARLLGPHDYGQYGVVMSFLLVVEVFVITGIPIALQKYVAEHAESSRALVRRTLPWHLFYSAAVFALFFLTAPVLAWLYEDGSLKLYLQVAAIDILMYGLYKYIASLHNGLHAFRKQAAMTIAYAVCKPAAMVVLVLMGYGVTGAVVGNMLGSVGGLLLGLLLLRMPALAEHERQVPFFKFAFTNVFYYVGLQLLMSIDIWFVKYYVQSQNIGLYVAAASIAKIPYMLSLAVSNTVLPSVARATRAGKEERVQTIVRIILRYWLMSLFAMIVVVAATAPGLMAVFFGEPYRGGGGVLALLFTALALLTFAAVMNTILISRDRLRPCLQTIAGLIAAHALANGLLVPRFGALGAAGATLLVAILANGVSGYLLLRETRVVMPPLSALRTILAGAGVLALALNWPLFDNWLVLKCAAVLGLFIAALVALRELELADLQRLVKIVNGN